MAGLDVYEFPARPSPGLLLGLSASRLAVFGAAGVVFIVTMAHPTLGRLSTGLLLIVLLVVAATVRVAGRVGVEWVGVAGTFGWARTTGNDRFRAGPHLGPPLPDGLLDLPGELAGLELRTARIDSGRGAFGVVADLRWRRLVAVAELSGPDFLFLDPDEQQTRIGGWGRLLDHVADTLPDIARVQIVHRTTPVRTDAHTQLQHTAGGHGTPDTADSYREVVDRAVGAAQSHRLHLAIALDTAAARRAIRRAGGGPDGGHAVLLERAATIEDLLTAAGVSVHGWLDPSALATTIRNAWDPHDPPAPTGRLGDDAGAVGAGPAAADDGWRMVRHDRGWSATLQLVGPPSRPATGDLLQHLLIGIPATRRLSMLLVPTPTVVAERRAQTAQVSADAEQALRSRWGFATSARQARTRHDAATREADLATGRTVHRVVWLVTVTADTPHQLEGDVAQVEAAARRCALVTRRLVGTQRAAAGFTLPLCRGAR